MGYSYLFMISLVQVPDNLKSLSGQQFIYVLENTYKPLFKQIYDKYKFLPWFPDFGVTDSSGAKGYGTGLKNKFYEVIGHITQNFPDFTFGIYLFHWDFKNITYLTIKNTQILQLIEGPNFEESLKYPEINIENKCRFKYRYNKY